MYSIQGKRQEAIVAPMLRILRIIRSPWIQRKPGALVNGRGYLGLGDYSGKYYFIDTFSRSMAKKFLSSPSVAYVVLGSPLSASSSAKFSAPQDLGSGKQLEEAHNLQFRSFLVR